LDVLASNLAANEASTSGRAQAHALDWAQRGSVQQLLRRLNVVPHIAMASGTSRSCIYLSHSRACPLAVAACHHTGACVIGGVVATVRCCCWYADVCYSNEGLDLLVPTLLELCAVAPRVTIWFAQVRRSVLAVARRKSRDVEVSSHGGGRCVRRARIISFPCMWESVAATTRALERLRIEIGVRGRSQDKECVPGGTRIADKFFERMLPEAGFCVQCHPSEQLLSREWSDPNVAFYRVSR